MQVLTGLRFVSFAVKRRAFSPTFSPNKWEIKLTDTTRQQNQTRHFLRLFFAQNFFFWQTRKANWKCRKSLVFERLFIVVRRLVNCFCKEKKLLLPVFYPKRSPPPFSRRNSHVRARTTRVVRRFIDPATPLPGLAARKRLCWRQASDTSPRHKGLWRRGDKLLPLKARSAAFGWNWK